MLLIATLPVFVGTEHILLYARISWRINRLGEWLKHVKTLVSKFPEWGQWGYPIDRWVIVPVTKQLLSGVILQVENLAGSSLPGIVFIGNFFGQSSYV